MTITLHHRLPDAACALSDGRFAVVGAIPAFNEEALIGACMAAFLRQQDAPSFALVIFANNCTDRTTEIVGRFAQRAAFPVHLYDVAYPTGAAPAARARRLSVNAAMALCAPDGVIMMSDADSEVSPNWVSANLAEINAGADSVCGLIAPNLFEVAQFPEAVLQRGVAEFGLEQAAAELEALLDPTPWDPWPHHRMETGASLAVRAAMLARVGGVPEVQPAEDRALIAAIRSAGGKVRHAYGPTVSTSCRIDGRAQGGWADDLRQRVTNPAGPCHDLLEPTALLYRRAILRARFRGAWPSIEADAWARALRVSREIVARAAALESFGAAWAMLERASPRLRPQRLAFERLGEETRRARRLLARRQAANVSELAGAE